MPLLRALLLAGLALPPGSATAEELQNWLEGPGLTGSWRDERSRLVERGIEPWARYTSGFWSNVDGGIETGTRYEGFAQWGLDLDLERLAGWRGTSFHIDWHAYHGGQPSEDLIGQFSAENVSNWEAEDSVRFYHIHLRQRLFDDKLLLKAGQLTADDDFFVSEYAQLFLNATLGDFTSTSTALDAPVYPLAAPGLYLFVRPAKQWFARIGVYTADTGDDESNNFGFDWGFDADAGAVLFAEAGTHRSPLGLPGTYTLGAFGGTGDQEDFESGGTVDGLYGLYAMFDQALLLGREGNPRLGAFFRATYAPQDDRTVVRHFVDGGFSVFGPIPGRRDDVLGVSVSYLEFQSDYLSSVRSSGQNVTGEEVAIELTYRAAITPWLSLQPDLQIFLDPHFSRRDATVIGLRAVIDL